MSNKKLSDLPNIGNTVEKQLNMVGITSEEELKKTGSKQAWLRIQGIDESACINRLLALEGAIEGIKKSLLSEEIKKDLKEFYNCHKITKA
jgi:DNA transformation protein and related proteins